MKPDLATVLLCLSLFSIKADAQTNATLPKSSLQKSDVMKVFSLLVRVPVTYTTEQAKKAGPLWDVALEHWKATSVYVTSFAFPGESYVVAGPDKSIREETVLSGNLRVVSNIVLRAATMEAALELAKDCPVLAYGGTVEVREIPRGVQPVD